MSTDPKGEHAEQIARLLGAIDEYRSLSGELYAKISRLTAELADEKAVNEHQRSELQDRVKKQRATEAELSSTQQQLGECSGGYETLEREVASLRAELEEARKDAGLMSEPALEAAAKAMAEAFDYPWEHMPTVGRINMRTNARNVISAALAATQEKNHAA